MTTTRTIHLGFEVGSGQAVEIPIRHMAVTGQTQEAGKTTTLEALIARAALRALTFVTKRGEGAFTSGRPTAPYFREQADWRFVSSMLEAFLGERLKFERSWIMRATKGAKRLKDVRLNLRELQEHAKGLNADVYMVLGEYLDELVPAIAAIDWAPKVDLAAGVNVMDLAAVPTSMQHLVIKSSIDWVLEHEEKTVVVVPEAWKFIPQGRGTPVRHSAMAYIRQGAALENYLWLDSQDIGGVDKELLRSVPVWILGVQREANEIKRTLSNIPATVAKPKPADVALLELGQFYACWGKHAIRTYVQPAWMADDLARQVATGKLDVRNAAAIASGANVVKAARAAGFTSVGAIARSMTLTPKEETVTKDEAARLERDLEALRDENRRWRETHEGIVKENDQLRRRVQALEKGRHDSEGTPAARSVRQARQPETRPHRGELPDDATASRVGNRPPEGANSNDRVDEALYQAIKARLVDEAPALLTVLAERPELEVEVERKTVTVDGSSLKGRLARLIATRFFDDGKTQGATRSELKRTGSDVNQGTLWRAMTELVKDGFLTAESGNTYRAVADMKVNIVERRTA